MLMLLINVVDISDIDYKNKEKVTIETLRMANVSESKINEMITVYNKIDLNPFASYYRKTITLLVLIPALELKSLKERLINY